MELLWFYIAVVLAISDVLHTTLMWKVLNDFYILLGGLIQQSTKTTWQTWLIHETMEAGFHFVIDVTHTVFIRNMGELEHRALHFVVESIFFILIYGF